MSLYTSQIASHLVSGMSAYPSVNTIRVSASPEKAFTVDAETKIIFTDGYAEMPETRCDAIWLVYSDTPVNPPGGRVLYVKKPEEIKGHEIDFLIT